MSLCVHSTFHMVPTAFNTLILPGSKVIMHNLNVEVELNS